MNTNQNSKSLDNDQADVNGLAEWRTMVERLIIENRNSLNDPTTNEPYDVKGIADDVIELLQQVDRESRLDERRHFDDEIDDVLRRHVKNRDLSPMAELRDYNFNAKNALTQKGKS